MAKKTEAKSYRIDEIFNDYVTFRLTGKTDLPARIKIGTYHEIVRGELYRLAMNTSILSYDIKIEPDVQLRPLAQLLQRTLLTKWDKENMTFSTLTDKDIKQLNKELLNIYVPKLNSMTLPESVLEYKSSMIYTLVPNDFLSGPLSVGTDDDAIVFNSSINVLYELPINNKNEKMFLLSNKQFGGLSTSMLYPNNKNNVDIKYIIEPFKQKWHKLETTKSVKIFNTCNKRVLTNIFTNKEFNDKEVEFYRLIKGCHVWGASGEVIGIVIWVKG